MIVNLQQPCDHAGMEEGATQSNTGDKHRRAIAEAQRVQEEGKSSA